MSIISFGTLLCGVLTLLIGYRVFLLNWKNHHHQAFFALGILFCWMNICWYEMSQTNELDEVLYWRRLQAVWTFIHPLMLYYFWRFAGIQDKPIPPFWKILFWSANLLAGSYFFYLEVFTDQGHGEVVQLGDRLWGLRLEGMDGTTFWRAMWILANNGLAIFFAALAAWTEPARVKKRWKTFILIVFSVGFIVSFIQNYTLPIQGITLPLNESLTSLITTLLFGWILLDFNLLEITPENTQDRIANSMTNLLLITDPQLRVEKINRATRRFFAGEPGALIGRRLGDLFKWPDLDEARRELAAGTGQQEIELQLKERKATLLITISEIYNRRNRLIGYTVVGTDLTEFKVAEGRIRHYVRELEQTKDTLAQFAYVASHDLKEPLRSVSSFATLLDRQLAGAEDERIREYLTYITQGVDRMYQILESFLDYSLLDAKNLPLETVDTRAVLNRVIRQMTSLLQEKNARIESDAMPEVEGYATYFELVFLNLIENATLYNQSDPPEIVVHYEKLTDMHCFTVRDNGIGIDPAFHGKVFKLFQRLHRRSEYQGMGMGLAVCKKIIERAGGRIWLESIPGEGTTVFFTLPLVGRENGTL